jgi:ubiquinone/menaquinone biosynthesis C-methylase UbiE
MSIHMTRDELGPHSDSGIPDELQSMKTAVHDFWNRASCGEVYASGEAYAQQLKVQAQARYALEPYIFELARFEEGCGKDVLEIGVGMGADHLEWAKSHPNSLSGVDLTERAIEHTSTRMSIGGFVSDLRVADAEDLPFFEESFDLVYSWGVLHHSPNTPAAVREVWRVLRPGGIARIMIYHKHSIVGYLLWIRYALLTGRLDRGLEEIYAKYLESPGTKAFTPAEARQMFAGFRETSICTRLAFGDLLEGAVGQRHGGVPLRLAKRLWPRWLLRRIMPGHGLILWVEARK